MEWYTKTQIEKGQGTFTNGRNAAIYASEKRATAGREDIYCTAEVQDSPGSGLELVGYIRNDRRLVVTWL